MHTEAPTESLDELTDNFSLFDDWEDKYRYIIELGDKLEVFDEDLKTDENRVRGCTSRVWMVTEIIDGHLFINADSDARIVRGLIYLLLAAYQGRTAEEILSYDINSAFQRLGLDKHLSPSRRNGFFAMVDRIRGLVAGV